MIAEEVARLYREEHGRLLATLIRLLSDFELAEESLQEAYAAAVDVWTREGLPRAPRAWLLPPARFQGLDQIRRSAAFARRQDDLARELADMASAAADLDAVATDVDDDAHFPDE